MYMRAQPQLMRYNAHAVIVNIACAIIAAILSAFLWLSVMNLLLWANTLKGEPPRVLVPTQFLTVRVCIFSWAALCQVLPMGSFLTSSSEF